MQTVGRPTPPERARRPARPLALMLLILVVATACGGSVSLLTGRGSLGPVADGDVSCYTDFAVGQLVVDAAYGAAIVENGRPTPVMWPPGYTARRAGSEVEVLDPHGSVVARTGSRYQIEGGHGGENPAPSSPAATSCPGSPCPLGGRCTRRLARHVRCLLIARSRAAGRPMRPSSQVLECLRGTTELMSRSAVAVAGGRMASRPEQRPDHLLVEGAGEVEAWQELGHGT